VTTPRPSREGRPDERPLFMISIAAELAGMHPQTLRIYERRGLVAPRRTARNTRLYSEADVERLRRIQELSGAGLNLAGIERVMELERKLERAELREAALQAKLADFESAARRDLAALRRSLRGELVHVGRPAGELAVRYPPVVKRPG
jgi:MerR family transcriptional regulator/heat shock protein HspR